MVGYESQVRKDLQNPKNLKTKVLPIATEILHIKAPETLPPIKKYEESKAYQKLNTEIKNQREMLESLEEMRSALGEKTYSSMKTDYEKRLRDNEKELNILRSTAAFYDPKAKEIAVGPKGGIKGVENTTHEIVHNLSEKLKPSEAEEQYARAKVALEKGTEKAKVYGVCNSVAQGIQREALATATSLAVVKRLYGKQALQDVAKEYTGKKEVKFEPKVAAAELVKMAKAGSEDFKTRYNETIH